MHLVTPAPMCTDLQTYVDKKTGEIREGPCRKCKRCLDNRLNDLAGRAYAEALTADSFVALTLTYADSNSVNSQVLVYSDVQKMLKRLRKDGFRLRYIVAGEYGSARGRAHWHMIIWFYGKAPAFPPEETEKVHWKYWNDGGGKKAKPLGFVFVQRPDFHGLRYVLKYALKDEADAASDRRAMFSKKPPLGAYYWPKLAKQRIKEGLPFRREFGLPGAKYANGNSVRFFLSGASLLRAWKAHRDEWHKLHRSTEPGVFPDDLEPLLRARRRDMDWGSEAWRSVGQSFLTFADVVPAARFVRKSGQKIRVFGKITLTRNRWGELWATSYDRRFGKVECRTWPVESLQEVFHLVRGRHKLPPRKIGPMENKPPF